MWSLARFSKSCICVCSFSIEMTEKSGTADEDCEPVSKRTRRSGVVASVGDPLLKDRTKVASIFLSKAEKQERLSREAAEKLRESTKVRLADWKSVIGVEKDASKVCPVFQKASLVPSVAVAFVNVDSPPVVAISPIFDASIIPVPVTYFVKSCVELKYRKKSQILYPVDPEQVLHRTLFSPRIVDLSTPLKRIAPSVGVIADRCVGADACLDALKNACDNGLVTSWGFSNSKDWNAARLDRRVSHGLAKTLAKWKDEDGPRSRTKTAPILLLVGPVGVGKTSLVYACALELGLQVLEVSPSDFSWESNGKRPLNEAVKEALQSRQASAGSQIVLIDDVDVLIKEDRSVISQICAMTADSKRPLVLTCTNVDCFEFATQIFHLEPPNEKQCECIFQACMKVIGLPSAPYTHTGGDLRQVAMAVELEKLGGQSTQESQLESEPCDGWMDPWHGDGWMEEYLTQMDPLHGDVSQVDQKTLHESAECQTDLILPFLFAGSWMSFSCNQARRADTLDCLSTMAQFSNNSQFSSRRVRCILDQFYAPEKVLQLRQRRN